MIQRDPWFKAYLESHVNRLMGTFYECNFSGHVNFVNLFFGTFEMCDIMVTGKDNYDWSWQAEQVSISWSWFDLLRYGSCGLHLTFDHITCNSNIVWSGSQNFFAITPHFVLFTMPAEFDIPCSIASVAIRSGSFLLYDTTKSYDLGYVIRCNFSSDAHISYEAFWAALRITDCSVVKDGIYLIKNFEGDGFSYIPSEEHKKAGVECNHTTITARCEFPRLSQEDQEVSLHCDWKENFATCVIRNDDRTLDIALQLKNANDVTGDVTLPIKYGISLLQTDDKPDVSGEIAAQFKMDLRDLDGAFHVNYAINNARYYGFTLPNIDGEIWREKEQKIIGNIFLHGPDNQKAHGSWSFDIMRSYCKGSLSTDSWYKIFESWFVDNCKVKIYGELGAFHSLSVDLTGQIKHANFDRSYPFTAVLNSNKYQLFCSVKSEDKQADVSFGYKPYLHCDMIRYDEQGQRLIDIEGESDGSFQGSCSYSLLRRGLQSVGFDAAGEGLVQCNGRFNDGLVQASLSLDNALIRVPSTYTVVQGARCDVAGDFARRKFICKDFQATLYKGSVSASNIDLWFDRDWRVSFFHAPLLLHDCFLSWKKEIFAQLSGMFFVRYRCPNVHAHEQLSVNGQIVLEQSHLRGNVLSAEFQRDLLGSGTHSMLSPVQQWGQSESDYRLDVAILTRDPIEVKTPFLDTRARCSVHLGGLLQDPTVTGSINFLDGTLNFPYRPLFITRGTLTFVPNRSDDPLIDLVARNTIKKYAVELGVHGSVQAPRISFSSSPALEREQIITLLLGGSEDGSLYLVMPQVLTNTLEHLMFGSAEASSRVQKYLKSLFQPLKSIRLTPHFSEQTGRGGVRGSVAVEVGDRLQATFAKNFNLSEDATYEVEYLLSDDTSVRLIKDERGDVGFEGEMRWKF